MNRHSFHFQPPWCLPFLQKALASFSLSSHIWRRYLLFTFNIRIYRYSRVICLHPQTCVVWCLHIFTSYSLYTAGSFSLPSTGLRPGLVVRSTREAFAAEVSATVVSPIRIHLSVHAKDSWYWCSSKLIRLRFRNEKALKSEIFDPRYVVFIFAKLIYSKPFDLRSFLIVWWFPQVRICLHEGRELRNPRESIGIEVHLHFDDMGRRCW